MSPRLALTALLALAPLSATAADPKAMVVTPLAQADFQPVNGRERLQNASIAVLRGDSAKAPSTMLLRMPKSLDPMHVHTHDYELVIVEGRMKHWAAGQSEAAAEMLGPGGYWFQPGGKPHADVCLSDSCLMVVTFSGPADGRLAPDASAADAAKGMVVTPLAEEHFKPVSAHRPDGAAIAVLRGDPATGPSAMLLRMPKGPGQLHIHTHDYELTIVEGRMKHWAAGGSEAAAPELGPGGYWFQPGGQTHADSCLSDRCLMLVTWSGPRDGRLPDPTR